MAISGRAEGENFEYSNQRRHHRNVILTSYACRSRSKSDKLNHATLEKLLEDDIHDFANKSDNIEVRAVSAARSEATTYLYISVQF